MSRQVRQNDSHASTRNEPRTLGAAALERVSYSIVGSCALYISLRPYFTRWNGSPSLVTLGYWICAGVLFAATLAPMTDTILGLIGSASITALLVSEILSPPTASDPVNHPLSHPVLATILIFTLASLLLSLLRCRPVMNTKKPYTPPRLTVYDPASVPELVGLVRGDVILAHVPATYTTVVDQDHNFIEVSENFSRLLGYKPEELLGTQYDHLTVPNTADILSTYNLFSKLGYMHGLWMLNHRNGHRIVIRYEAWLRPDANIQSNIELVQNII